MMITNQWRGKHWEKSFHIPTPPRGMTSKWAKITERERHKIGGAKVSPLQVCSQPL